MHLTQLLEEIETFPIAQNKAVFEGYKCPSNVQTKKKFWGSAPPLKLSWFWRPRAVLQMPAEFACFGHFCVICVKYVYKCGLISYSY